MKLYKERITDNVIHFRFDYRPIYIHFKIKIRVHFIMKFNSFKKLSLLQYIILLFCYLFILWITNESIRIVYTLWFLNVLDLI